MAKIRPIEEVIKRIKEIHGDNITIDPFTYKGYNLPADFTHKIHGRWTTKVRSVLEGRTHKKAFYDRRRFPVETAIDKLKKLHDGKVTLVESTYKGTNKKCTFVHSEYGSWDALPNSVINMGTNHPLVFAKNKMLKKEAVESQLFYVHGDSITIIWDSFRGTHMTARFIHKIHGEFESLVSNIIRGQGPLAGSVERHRATNIARYGYPIATQNKEVALKAAKTQQKTTIRYHWKTGEELVCQASWEPKVVDYLNTKKIEFEWQSKVFETNMVSLKGNIITYRPDFYLIKSDKWIEIKGYFRKDALAKWQWFQSEYPNSELWDQKKLKEMGIL